MAAIGYSTRTTWLRRHSAALATTAVMHVAIVAALVVYRPDVVREVITYVPFRPIEADTPPPPIPFDPVPTAAGRADKTSVPSQPTDRSRQATDASRPVDDGWPQPLPSGPGSDSLGGGSVAKPVEPIVVEPVLTAATLDPRYMRDLQPPYPSALQREEVEGVVTVRLSIGADGRVTGVELVRADDDRFFTATRDWVLKRWRFKPATRDGVAVVTTVVKTVRFRIG